MTILYHPRPERWPQVSLKGLFVLVTILGVWLGVQVKWKNDRHAEWQWIDDHENGALLKLPPARQPKLPWGLRMIGEIPLGYIPVDMTIMSQQDLEHLKEVQALFPEAKLFLLGMEELQSQIPEDQWIPTAIKIFRPLKSRAEVEIPCRSSPVSRNPTESRRNRHF